jgi:hypothetical protein
MHLLVQSLKSNNLTIVHQATDTLKTIISDRDIIPRIMPHVTSLLGFIEECFKTVNIPSFFEFASNFLKSYQSNILVGQYNTFLECIVSRLMAEASDCINNGFKTNMAIQKIWDIIQDFTNLSCVQGSPDVLTLFETTLQPAFSLIQNAEQLDFDDSIIKTMAFFIESQKGIS